MPASMSFREDYEAVKKAHPGDIVLYQLGDFYDWGTSMRCSGRMRGWPPMS